MACDRIGLTPCTGSGARETPAASRPDHSKFVKKVGREAQEASVGLAGAPETGLSLGEM